MPTDNTLWIPPLSPKAQKKINNRHRELFKWTGFSGKTLWDWLQLLAALTIPIVIAAGTLWFSAQQNEASSRASERQHQTDIQIAQDQQQETTLQTYLDLMSDLLLNKKLRESQLGDEVRDVARSRTLTMLPQLNGIRKGEVLHFLNEAGLIDREKIIVNPYQKNIIVNLSGANLIRVDLSGTNTHLRFVYLGNADLSNANLNHTDFIAADLSGDDLSAANLSGAALSNALLFGATLRNANLSSALLPRVDLRESDLRGADLRDADLSAANLYGAKVTQEQLNQASSLRGATMPDGSIHP